MANLYFLYLRWRRGGHAPKGCFLTAKDVSIFFFLTPQRCRAKAAFTDACFSSPLCSWVTDPDEIDQDDGVHKVSCHHWRMRGSPGRPSGRRGPESGLPDPRGHLSSLTRHLVRRGVIEYGVQAYRPSSSRSPSKSPVNKERGNNDQRYR